MGENLNTFLSKSVTQQGCPLFPLLFNMVIEFLARATGHKKELKEIEMGKEEIKLSLFTVDIILYLKHPKYSKTLRSHKCFGKVAGYKISM
jgi:hypothetical protein